MLTHSISAVKFIAYNQLFQPKARLLRCKIVVTGKNAERYMRLLLLIGEHPHCVTAFYVNATLENEGANVGQGGR